MIMELLLPAMLSALFSKILMDWWLRTAPKLGFLGKDMNKPGEHYSVEASGILVVLSSVFGILAYIALETYTDMRSDLVPMMSISMTLLLAGLLGFFDDILGWKKGISPAKRVLFTIPISIPLVVVKAGTSTVELPFIGAMDLGLIYPLVIVPIGILGASNAFNMIAGYNGLESLQGLILLASASILCYSTGRTYAVYIMSPVIVAILMFYLFYNKYPARAFPGNSFTYGIGAFYASLAIYWNFEKYAILSFTLYFVELLLFIRGLLNGVYKENFGKVQSDGSLIPPYEKSYSITHLAIKIVRKVKGKCFEPDVVKTIAIMQLLVCVSSLAIVFLIR
jgi:UDP-N-acetylmuramyl pentapeptide phosphotransferase/UDP-N-acetylglucosamine-1-phosphate transferase